MAVNDLTLPTWNTLDEARQKFIFQQLTRYFLSPLLSVDDIRPLTVTFLPNFAYVRGNDWRGMVTVGPGDA